MAFMMSEVTKDEPPITNLEWLDSYRDFGVWLRCLLAYQQMQVLHTSVNACERVAATAHFCSALGALAEDTATQLLAWMCWHRDPSARLLDIIQLCAIKQDASSPSDDYVDQTVKQLLSAKRTYIDVKRLALSMGRLEPIEIVRLCGIPWSPNPMSLRVTKAEMKSWRLLPGGVTNVLTSLSSESMTFTTRFHNKVKHGPQVMMARYDEWLCKLGRVEEAARFAQSGRRHGFNRETLRVMLDGATTEPTAKHQTPTWWIFDDPTNIFDTFQSNLYQLTKVMWLMASWLRKQHCGNVTWKLPTPLIADMENHITSWRAAVQMKD